MGRRDPLSTPLIGILTIMIFGFSGAARADGPSGEGSPEGYVVSKTRVVRAPSSDRSGPAAGLSGLLAVVDPATGSLVSAPPGPLPGPLVRSARLAWRLSTSHEGLEELRLLSGGVMIDLQGRFVSVLHARIGDDGAALVTHSPPEREAEPKEER